MIETGNSYPNSNSFLYKKKTELRVFLKKKKLMRILKFPLVTFEFTKSNFNEL